MSEGCVKAIYPGSFDPPTLGHLDITRRAQQIFGRLTVAILRNPRKSSCFDALERKEMFEEAIREAAIPGVEVVAFEGLLVDFAKKQNSRVIVRGLRAISDYEYELELAQMNRRLLPQLETVFLTPGEELSYLSSRLVREIAQFGGDVSGLVPRAVLSRLTRRFASEAEGGGGRA